MTTAQAIAYYAFETLAVLIILGVGSVVAIMAIGALVDRYQRIFGSVDDAEIARAHVVQVHLAGRDGRI